MGPTAFLADFILFLESGVEEARRVLDPCRLGSSPIFLLRVGIGRILIFMFYSIKVIL